MKKSVAIIVAAVYVASIVLIAFFGMQIYAGDPPVLVTKIVCVNDNIIRNVGYDGEVKTYLKLEYEPGLNFFLFVDIYPKNATDQRVEFTYVKSDNYEVTPLRMVIFYEKVPFTVTIRALDGSNVYEEVEFLFVK